MMLVPDICALFCQQQTIFVQQKYSTFQNLAKSLHYNNSVKLIYFRAKKGPY